VAIVSRQSVASVVPRYSCCVVRGARGSETCVRDSKFWLHRAMAGSSTDPPPAAPGPAKTHDNAKLVEHTDYLTLDTLPDKSQVLTHSGTLSRQVLPMEGWPYYLVFLDGFGVLVPSGDEHQAIIVEEWLERAMWQRSDGELVIVERCPVKGQLPFWSLTAKLREHTQHRVMLKIVGHCERYELHAFGLRWPRANGRYCFSAFDVYAYLQLTSYKGQPSKWAYESYAGWSKKLEKLHLADGIMKSYMSLPQKEALTSTTHVLSTPSFTTNALLTLLSKWSCLHVRRCGFTDDCRQRAKDLIKSFVDASCQFQYSIDVLFNYSAVPQWPRPFAFEGDFLRLQVGTDGVINAKEWKDQYAAALVGGSAPGPLFVWWRLISHLVTDLHFIQLRDLVTSDQVIADQTCMALLAQMFAAISLRVDVVLGKSVTQEDSNLWPIYIKDVDSADGWSAREVDKACLEHVYRGKMASDGHRSIGIALDKVNARGLDLQNSICVLKNNIAFELVPQVAFFWRPVEGKSQESYITYIHI
jgi:hypothetical protein